MDRKLTIERLYNLGNYSNIKVGDTIKKKVVNEVSGIPEELWLDANFINKLRYLQLVQTEQAFFKYVEEFFKKYHLEKSLENIIEIIEELDGLEIKTTQELKDIIQGE